MVRELNFDCWYGVECMIWVSFGFWEFDGGGFNLLGIECECYDLCSNIM